MSGEMTSERPPGQGPFTVPSETPADLREVGKELSRIEERARYSSQGQFEQAKLWRKVNGVLGTFTAIVTALAGVLTFAADNPKGWAGAAAIGASLLVAAMTAIAPERRADRAERAANSYLGIQTRARRALLIDLPQMSKDEGATHVEVLSTDMDDTNRNADPISGLARRKGSQNIDSGGQVYGVDEL